MASYLEAAGIYPPAEAHVSTILDSVAVEESAFRSYIRRCSCCICDHAGSKNINGEPIAYKKTEKETGKVYIYQVSDIAHIKTRGAGGDDIENIVPLCRLHHNELHQYGILTFEIRYNFDLRNRAVSSYQEHLDSLRESDHLEFARQAHQRLMARIEDVHRLAYLTGKYLCEFREMRVGDKMLYTWLGFHSFNEYITAPSDNGGLGLSSKTAYRWINFYQVHQLLPQEKAAMVGIAKADPTMLLLKEAKTEEDKQEVIEKATTLSAKDFNRYANEELGRPDKATQTFSSLYEIILLLLDAHGVRGEDVRDDVVEQVSRRIISTVLGGGRHVQKESFGEQKQ